jgi:PAS domain S-box-containing protein
VLEAQGLTNTLVQQTLLGEAVAAAGVGFVLWDDDRRYVAANSAACELLGCSLEQLIGTTVGTRTRDGSEVVAHVVQQQLARGRVTVDRFDGGGTVELEYVTFATRAAGLPYMGSLIWREQPPE